MLTPEQEKKLERLGEDFPDIELDGDLDFLLQVIERLETRIEGEPRELKRLRALLQEAWEQENDNRQWTPDPTGFLWERIGAAVRGDFDPNTGEWNVTDTREVMVVPVGNFERKLIEDAAAIQGLSVEEFVVAVVLQRALRVVPETRALAWLNSVMTKR